MENKTEKKKMSLGKKFLIGFGVLLLLIIIANLGGNDKASTNTQAQEPSTTEKVSKTELKYTEVFRFKGNGMKKSATFKLDGNNAKVKYNYDSGLEEGGMFSVYVVDKGKDVQVDGGIPEIMISSAKETSEGSIQKSKGEYYLNVNASGNWEVIVEEEK